MKTIESNTQLEPNFDKQVFEKSLQSTRLSISDLERHISGLSSLIYGTSSEQVIINAQSQIQIIEAEIDRRINQALYDIEMYSNELDQMSQSQRDDLSGKWVFECIADAYHALNQSIKAEEIYCMESCF